MVAECRRYAARVPDRLHLGGARVREVDLGCRQRAPCRLEHQRRAPLRKRAAVQYHDVQRSRRLPLQQPETAQSRLRGRCGGVQKWRLRSERRPLLQSSGMDGPWSASIRERGPARWNGARIPDLQRRSEYLQGVPDGRSEQDAGGGVDREYLQPGHVLRSEYELEFRQLRLGQHAM